MKTLRFVGLFATLIFGTSCTTYVELVVETRGDTLDPSEVSNSNAVDVRFYHLKSPGRWNETQPGDLWADEEAALGDSLDKTHVTLPISVSLNSGTQRVKIMTVDGVEYLGVFAVFHYFEPGDTVMRLIEFKDIEQSKIVLEGTQLLVEDR